MTLLLAVSVCSAPVSFLQQLYAVAAEAASYMRAYNHLPAPSSERDAAGIDPQRKRLYTRACSPSSRWRISAEFSESAGGPPA